MLFCEPNLSQCNPNIARCQATCSSAPNVAYCQTACSSPPPPASWNCVGGNCIDPGDGSGTYSSLSACQYACVPAASWNCVGDDCIDPGDGSGTYSSLEDCEEACSTTCACDPMPTAWQFTITGISNGTYTDCPDTNGTWLLNDFYGPDETFDGSCAWYGPPIPAGTGFSLYWGIFNTPNNVNGDWGLQLQFWDDTLGVQTEVWVGYVNTTVSGFDCNDPVSFGFQPGNPYSIETNDCTNYPLTVTVTPIF